MLNKETLEYISQNSLFSEIDIKELEKLKNSYFNFTKHNEGYTLVIENSQADEMYLIISGIVRITKNLPNGEEGYITSRSNGEYIGELALIRNGKRSANIYCKTPVELITIKKDVFFLLLKQFPSISANLSTTIAKRLAESDQKTIIEIEKYEALLVLHQKINSQKDELEILNEKLIDTNEQLREALTQISTLNGMLPICSSCKKIRNDDGYWQQLESYISSHSEAKFSHSLCKECADNLYSELETQENTE